MSCSDLLHECYMMDVQIAEMFHEKISEGHENGEGCENGIMSNETEEMDEDRSPEIPVGESVRRYLPGERPNQMEALVRRAHRGLGHIGNERLARILKGPHSSPEAVEYAKRLECDVCQDTKGFLPQGMRRPLRN